MSVQFDGDLHSRDRPEVFVQITDTGTDLKLNLDGYVVHVIATNNDIVRTYDAEIADAANGIASFQVTELDTLEPGFLELHFVARHVENDSLSHGVHSSKIRYRVHEARAILT